MKSANLILIGIASHIGFFLLLSVVGFVLGNSYLDCIHSMGWFTIYTLTFGWIFDMMICSEYISRNKEYFKKHLSI